MAKRIRWINVKKAVQDYYERGSPDIEFISDPITEDNTVPYAWSSQLTHDLSESCPLKGAYDIAYKYDNSILPEGVSLAISPGLRKLFDQALDEELKIAKAIAYAYPNMLYNHRITDVGKPDIVADNQVLEIKFTSKKIPQWKWLYQIAAYMQALNLDMGQIVMVSREDYSITCYRVIRKDDEFLMDMHQEDQWGSEFAGPMIVSLAQLLQVKEALENDFNSILQGARPNPPFDSPVLIEDGKPKSNHCLYIRDRDEHIYFQCHGTTLTGDRCKRVVTDNPLCDVHNKQEMTMEIEWAEPTVRAKCNCPWFSYCWKDTKYGNVEVK